MKEVNFEIVKTNGINIRVASMGEGPLVIFCHGWPESWYSYRHQLPAVASAGYKACSWFLYFFYFELKLTVFSGKGNF